MEDGGWHGWRMEMEIKAKSQRQRSKIAFKRFCSFTPTIMSNIGRQADIHLWKSLYTCMSSVSPSRIQGGRTMDRRMNREFPPPFLIFGCVLICVDGGWWWSMITHHSHLRHPTDIQINEYYQCLIWYYALPKLQIFNLNHDPRNCRGDSFSVFHTVGGMFCTGTNYPGVNTKSAH